MKKVTKKIMMLLFAASITLGDISAITSEAAAKLPKELWSQVKGKWYTQASSGGYDIKFTRAKIKYYNRDTGKLVYSVKIRKVKIIKSGIRKGDYRIIFKNTRGISSYISSKYGFDYYSGAAGYDGYSGSASISEGKWGE